MYKLAKIMEKMWLVLAIFASIYAIWQWYQTDFNQSKTYILVAVITIIWYVVRNNLRRRIEATIEREEGSSSED